MEKVRNPKHKVQLSAYPKTAEAGQTSGVTDRNKPVARLEPMKAGRSEAEHIALLVQRGLVSLPKAPPLSIEEIRRLRPVVPGAGVLEALLEERREGR